MRTQRQGPTMLWELHSDIRDLLLQEFWGPSWSISVETILLLGTTHSTPLSHEMNAQKVDSLKCSKGHRLQLWPPS